MYLEPFQQHEMIGNELKIPYSLDNNFCFICGHTRPELGFSCTSDIFIIKSFSD